MSRNPEYQFIDTDTATVEALLTSTYEQMTGVTLLPASPEKLFVKYVANIIVQERVLANYEGNQNIPSRAEGENLDVLGDQIYMTQRPSATAAVCTVRFHISEAQTSAILIPVGTRVTDTGNVLVWETTADAYIPIGDTYVDIQVKCQTLGTAGNGYAIGQVNKLVDIFDYYASCENITESDGGADAATDAEYYELMRASMDGYSCAGARGGYIYFAKSVSTEIADVVANAPTPGTVKLYVLMADGQIASEEIKRAVLAACSADEVRPLTDQVSVEDAEEVEYNISFTYYLQSDSAKSAAETAAAVREAVDEYIAWQSARLGRDINPSYLIQLLMQTGIKRVVLTEPAFTSLRDGSNNAVPQLPVLASTSITNGGYEDE